MNGWKNFLDSLATDGGHIVIFVFLIIFGVLLDVIKVVDEMQAHEITAGAFGALMYSMKSGKSNNGTEPKGGV